MTAALAKAMMALAMRSLGEARSDWALAMQAEFEEATQDRRQLAFAAGCLAASWRQMPAQEQGRFVLANYALALGLLIPMAGLQFACAAGSPLFGGQPGFYTVPASGGAQDLFLAEAHRSAIPSLFILWLMLGTGHLNLAWVVLERDWSRVMSTAALIVAVSTTLVIFSGVLLLNDRSVALQAILLAIELGAIHASSRWHGRLFPAA